MDRAATRSFPRRPVQWNRPMTKWEPEISRIDLHTKYQRRFEDEGTNPSLLSTFLSIPEFSPRLDYELPVFKNILDETILKRICEGNFETPTFYVAHVNEQIDGGFTLEFHLAYPVWTRDPSPRRDQRVTGDGLPLRKSTDLSFLPGAQKSDRITHGFDYLHEAQTSICVTGWDTSQWTAIRLTDSYFEDDSDPNKEYLLPFYVADPYPDQDMTSCELDAISIANLTADNVSVTDPREYFLLVVKFHVVRITEHWTNVLFKLKDMIEEYLSSPHIPLVRRESSLGTMRGESYAIEASEVWLGQTSDLVIQWILLLTKTIKAWDKFFDRDISRIVCQSSEDGISHMNDSLYEISRSLDEIMVIREEMEELKVKVERFEKKAFRLTP
ncbi:hypothetical protein CSAL01_09977 [Colletotrichum salicis]|uniref:Uncharacterized protein n=1 Tax=Colletotrichum salicis TaxID=1209931 RepID=A0A135S1T9_9PEZI|nr:hypothetical protein CSAL01_09977 [Colletotrichum salicis]